MPKAEPHGCIAWRMPESVLGNIDCGQPSSVLRLWSIMQWASNLYVCQTGNTTDIHLASVLRNSEGYWRFSMENDPSCYMHQINKGKESYDGHSRSEEGAHIKESTVLEILPRYSNACIYRGHPSPAQEGTILWVLWHLFGNRHPLMHNKGNKNTAKKWPPVSPYNLPDKSGVR